MDIQKISLSKGWNLVSFYLYNININELINNQKILEIKSLDKSYNIMVPKIFNTLDKIELDKGYFIKVSESFELEVSGDIINYKNLSNNELKLIKSNIDLELENRSIKIGLALAYTGPLDFITDSLDQLAKFAINEATDSGLFLGGKSIKIFESDTKCKTTSEVIDNTNELVKNGVVAIVGAMCSLSTSHIASNVTIPNKIPLITPAGTSTKISKLDDNNLVFRTAHYDGQEGVFLAKLTREKNIKKVAIIYFVDYEYEANEYVKYATSIGIEVAVKKMVEQFKLDYYDDISQLKNYSNTIIIFGSENIGGKELVEGLTEQKIFDTYILNFDMNHQELYTNKELNGSFISSLYTDKSYLDLVEKYNIDNIAFSAQSYDAAALIVLAIHAVGIENDNNVKNTDGLKIASKIQEISNGPGTEIYAGEITKGLKLLSAGEKINYLGATNVNFDNNGDNTDNFVYKEIKIESNEEQNNGSNEEQNNGSNEEQNNGSNEEQNNEEINLSDGFDLKIEKVKATMTNDEIILKIEFKNIGNEKLVTNDGTYTLNFVLFDSKSQNYLDYFNVYNFNEIDSNETQIYEFKLKKSNLNFKDYNFTDTYLILISNEDSNLITNEKNYNNNGFEFKFIQE